MTNKDENTIARESRQPQEYEFIMEGITTRMQMALEKMAESNRMMSESNRRLCRMFIAALVVVVLGFIVNNVIVINHINGIRRSEVSAHETVSQLGP